MRGSARSSRCRLSVEMTRSTRIPVVLSFSAGTMSGSARNGHPRMPRRRRAPRRLCGCAPRSLSRARKVIGRLRWLLAPPLRRHGGSTRRKASSHPFDPLGQPLPEHRAPHRSIMQSCGFQRVNGSGNATLTFSTDDCTDARRDHRLRVFSKSNMMSLDSSPPSRREEGARHQRRGLVARVAGRSGCRGYPATSVACRGAVDTDLRRAVAGRVPVA